MVKSAASTIRSCRRPETLEKDKIEFDEKSREAWWRESVRETPTPGTYPIRDFIEDALLNPVKQTYSFKGEGRKKMSIFQKITDPALPVATATNYYPPSFVELAKKRIATYSFKNTPRQSPTTLVYKDKNMSTDPAKYDLFPPPVPTFPTKNYMFRSAVQRSSIVDAKNQGPGPGEYEIREPSPVPLRSCFLSKVPRLKTAYTKVPGPGSYWPTNQSPKQPRTISSLGREHTIFFSNIPEI